MIGRVRAQTLIQCPAHSFAFTAVPDISAQQTRRRTFRRNKLGTGQTLRRLNSAQVKLGAGQTRRRSNSAQVKLGAEKK